LVVSVTQRLRARLSLLIRPAFVWWSLIALGISLRLWQYFFERSLSGDEASLAYNIVNRSFFGLTQPLDFRQAAPVGFLFIEKFISIVLGNQDYILRLVPLFAGIIAVYLFHHIARVHITGGMFASLLFAISLPLINYSSELKQYCSDVMIGLLLIFLWSRCLKENVQARDFLLLGIGGMIAIWISHPSVFILAGIGLAIFVATITRNRPVPVAWLLGLATMWIVSFGLEYFVSLRHLVDNEFLRNYWRKAFMPLPPDLPWIKDTYFSMLSTTLNRTDNSLALLLPVLSLIGGFSLLYRERRIGITLIAPFLTALIASALGEYPLKGRSMLFLVPFVLLLTADGLGRVYAITSKWNAGIARVIYALLALVIFLPTVSVTSPHFLEPSYGSNIKPVMEYVAKNGLQNENIYVFHSADSAFSYYAPFYGLDSRTIMIGKSANTKGDELYRFFHDVETLKGRERIWFVFYGVTDCGGCEGDIQSFYVNYLNERGTMRNSVNTNGASAYLYDLNP